VPLASFRVVAAVLAAGTRAVAGSAGTPEAVAVTRKTLFLDR
jgi:hypothetical protein